MSTVDFEAFLEQLYPARGDDVRAKLFSLMCDVAFVYVSSDDNCSFNVSLDSSLDAVEENVREMRAHRLSLLSLLSAVGGQDSGALRVDGYSEPWMA
ncbi:hypothetical protein [Nonomuraea cavernae]|uniref:hypothetical protein n=1 Tax=Nonomuraea cavernae TaxID=2045107 RepID=UPI0033FCA32B